MNPKVDFFFDNFPLIFAIISLVVFSMIAVNIISGIRTLKKNRALAESSMLASVISKRQSVSLMKQTGDTQSNQIPVTSYFAAFKLENGKELEFSLTFDEYEALNEGDTGKLISEGSQYIGFGRVNSKN